MAEQPDEISRLRDHYHTLNNELQKLYSSVGVMDERLKGLTGVTTEGIARIEHLLYQSSKDLKAEQAKFVLRAEFEPVKLIAYALVSFALLTLAGLLTAVFMGKFAAAAAGG